VAALAPTLAGAVLVERILAVVDGRPVMLSDVRAVEALDRTGRAAALERVIDETLLFQEASRLPQAAATPEASAPAMPPEIRRVAHRRGVIERYVAFRFRPQVRIDDDTVAKAYEEEAGGAGAGARDRAAGLRAVRARLTTAEVERRVAEWVKELRASARIRYNALEQP
jgi:hypothetical protein